jgi:hypothetical protein
MNFATHDDDLLTLLMLAACLHAPRACCKRSRFPSRGPSS